MSLNSEITYTTCPTITVQIYIGGPPDEAKRELALMAASVGMCVSIEPTEFVYTGGREVGSVVRLINYPRFPKDAATLEAEALVIAERLMQALGQASCSVAGPSQTVWLSRRALTDAALKPLGGDA